MKIYFSIGLVFCLLACTKQEIVVIEGNTPPTEQLVTSAIKQNYINRLYITVLGRKATETEFQQALTVIDANPNNQNRTTLVQNLVNTDEAGFQLYEVARNDFLDGLDTVTIQEQYVFYSNQLTFATGYYKEYLIVELAKIATLREAPYAFNQGSIAYAEVQKRVTNNIFYDDINMGTENFVVATFQNFLFRYPTQVELEEASKMVEGIAGYLFFTNGSSKQDFLELFFNSIGYAEGQVIDLHKKYLFRSPTSEEMVNMTVQYTNGASYTDLQTQILASDEYFFN